MSDSPETPTINYEIAPSVDLNAPQPSRDPNDPNNAESGIGRNVRQQMILGAVVVVAISYLATLQWGSVIVQSLMPIAQDFITTFAIAVVSYLTYYLRKWFGYQIEDKHRVALIAAMERGGKLAVDSAADGRVDPRVAVNYVRAAVPAAVRHFKVGDEFLERMAIPSIKDAIVSRTVPVPAATVVAPVESK